VESAAPVGTVKPAAEGKIGLPVAGETMTKDAKATPAAKNPEAAKPAAGTGAEKSGEAVKPVTVKGADTLAVTTGQAAKPAAQDPAAPVAKTNEAAKPAPAKTN